MKLFLTSNIGGSIKVDGKRVPTRLCEDNDMLRNIKDRWIDNSKVLIVGGAAYLISEGKIEKICDKGNRYHL